MGIVGVRLRPSERLRYVDDAGLSLSVDDRVMVAWPDRPDASPESAVVAVGSGQIIFSEVRALEGVVVSTVSPPNRPPRE